MIVRISGQGQYELDDAGVHRLEELDREVTDAIQADDEAGFHRALAQVVECVERDGTPVPHDRVVPSEVIVPPPDVTIHEARRYFTDDSHLEPLPA